MGLSELLRTCRHWYTERTDIALDAYLHLAELMCELHKERREMVKVMEDKSFQMRIYNDVEDAPNRIEFPDRTNKGKLIAMLMLWKRTADLADKKYETLMKQCIAEGVLRDPKSITTPGTFVIAEAGPLTIEANVSQPRREFNEEWFCEEMKKKYKVPIAATRELYEKSKQPGTSQTRRVTIKERGIG